MREHKSGGTRLWLAGVLETQSISRSYRLLLRKDLDEDVGGLGAAGGRLT